MSGSSHDVQEREARTGGEGQVWVTGREEERQECRSSSRRGGKMEGKTGTERWIPSSSSSSRMGRTRLLLLRLLLLLSCSRRRGGGKPSSRSSRSSRPAVGGVSAALCRLLPSLARFISPSLTHPQVRIAERDVAHVFRRIAWPEADPVAQKLSMQLVRFWRLPVDRD